MTTKKGRSGYLDDRELEKDMAEAFGHMSGKVRKLTRFKTQRYELPPAPAEVKALRASLKLSQSKFALLVNVGVRSVQAWEQGERQPDGAATALLWLLKSHGSVAEWLEERVKPTPALAEAGRR